MEIRKRAIFILIFSSFTRARDRKKKEKKGAGGCVDRTKIVWYVHGTPPLSWGVPDCSSTLYGRTMELYGTCGISCTLRRSPFFAKKIALFLIKGKKKTEKMRYKDMNGDEKMRHSYGKGRK